MAGRRTKYTPELANEIVAGIAIGLTDRDAAISAGISDDTLARYVKRYAGFAERVTRAKTQRTRLWLGGIRRAADQGDWKAYAELLDRCAPEYRKTQKHEVTSDVRHTYDLSRLSDEELDQLRALQDKIAAGKITS